MTETAVTETTAKAKAKPAAVVSLAAALVAAQAEMPRVKKDANNPHFNSKFMSLGGLIEATRPLLNKHGLALAQFPCVSELGPPVLRTVLIHGPSGERLEFETPLFVGAQNMQQLGSAITYARRYAWASLLGIASEDDDDGNTAGTAAPVPAAPEVRVITAAQRKRLRAIQKEKGVTDEHLKALVRDVAGVESSMLIPAVRYDALVTAVELAGSSFYAPAAVDADIPF